MLITVFNWKILLEPLFNTVLQKAIQDSNINTQGTTFQKSVQLLTYTDDIDCY